jgi:HEAT repeat protein
VGQSVGQRRNKRLQLLALVAAAPYVTLADDAPASAELAYKGRPVAAWVADLEPSSSVSNRTKEADAEEAIHALGPDAIPAILRYRRGNRTQRLDLIRHACAILEPEGDVKLVEALSDSDPAVRETALQVLPKTAMPAALDDITRLLADPVKSVKAAAILALVRLAPDREETIAALIEALHDLSPPSNGRETQFTREDAALELAKLGAKAKSAVPDLTNVLTDPNDSVREAAATALWKIERNSSVVPALAECLDGARDYQTCLRLLQLLGEIGAPAKAAVPVIVKKIEDPGVPFVPPNVDFGKAALEALTKIDPAAAQEARKKLKE